MMMQGYNLEDVTPGVDETLIRQPLGVVAAIVPFNFPAMIAFWFLPYAVACGNTFVLKPSERVPLTMKRIFELLEKTGLPKGVVNLVNGGREAVELSAIIHKSAPLASSAPLPSPNTSTPDPPPAENACSARAAQKITSWSCPTRTWIPPHKSSATAPSVAPASAAWQSPSRSPSAKLKNFPRFHR